MKRRPFVVGAAIALVALLVAGAIFLVRQTALAPKKITAVFTTASSIYPGDEVKVAASRSAPSRRSSRWERRPGSACASTGTS